MRTLAVLCLVALVAWGDEPVQRYRVGRGRGRVTRCDLHPALCGIQTPPAAFEAFPASGAGTTTACSTTAPTGAKGEVLTFTRASAATCTKGTDGLRSTNIADGDLVSLGVNVPRAEADADGYLGLLVEASGQSVLLRFIELCDAAWADVGTPALTGQTVTGTACATTTPQTSPFEGTFASAAVQIDDNDGAAFEGRSQAVTVSAGAAYFMQCYVKAGTATKARISIDGTTQDISGLSATTWSIVEKGDASSSGVSIPIQVLVGNAAGDTGTVIFGGCDVKAGTYRTSIVPTTSAAVTRVAEAATFPVVFPVAEGCAAASLTSATVTLATNQYWLTNDANSRVPYSTGAVAKTFDGTNVITSTPVVPFAVGVAGRAVARWSGSTLSVTANGTAGSGSFDGAMGAAGSTLSVGSFTGAFHVDGILSRIQLDPVATRCGQ